LAKALAEKTYYSQGANGAVLDMVNVYEKNIPVSTFSRGSSRIYWYWKKGAIKQKRSRRHPLSIILLDEIEKAHPDVF